MFSNDGIIGKPTTFSATFLCSLLQPDKKLRPRISFRVRKTDTDNQYKLYYRTSVDGSSVIEGVNFAVAYSPVADILPLHIIIAITSAKGLIIFVLYIYNDFQKKNLHNTRIGG